MAFLEQFTEKEKDLLASLPYKAGLWVGCADNEGGLAAQRTEREALEKIIARKGAGMFESAFVHEVMAETCTRKDLWDAWGEQLDNTVEDCEKAMLLLSKSLPRRDQDAYRTNIMFIATEVAKAFREFGEKEALPVKVFSFFRINADKVFGLITGNRYESEALLNISYEEDVALAKLSKALHVGVDDVAETVAIIKP